MDHYKKMREKLKKILVQKKSLNEQSCTGVRLWMKIKKNCILTGA